MGSSPPLHHSPFWFNRYRMPVTGIPCSQTMDVVSTILIMSICIIVMRKTETCWLDSLNYKSSIQCTSFRACLTTSLPAVIKILQLPPHAHLCTRICICCTRSLYAHGDLHLTLTGSPSGRSRPTLSLVNRHPPKSMARCVGSAD